MASELRSRQYWQSSGSARQFRNRIAVAQCAALALVSIASPSAHADDPEVNTRGEARAWFIDVTDIATRDDESEEGRATVVQRLRLGLDLEYDFLELVVEGDAFFGQIAGDPSPRDPTLDPEFPAASAEAAESFVPRQAYLSFDTPLGLVLIGHQTSQWGLGLLANDGVEKPMELFGSRYGGDIVERVLFATRPLAFVGSGSLLHNVIVAVGADLVYRDDLASLLDGDRATQGIGSVLYRSESSELGGYLAYRDQRFDEGDELRLLAVDGYGRLRTELRNPGDYVEVALEAVRVTGDTDRLTTDANPAKSDIAAYGVATSLTAYLAEPELTFVLASGQVSGDANAEDDTVYRFAADPDFNIGLVLFDHVLPAITETGARRAADPLLVAQPPPGLDLLPTRGRVSNAAWFHPAVLLGGEDGFAAGVAFLMAWSSQLQQDPLATFMRGGVPTNSYGKEVRSDILGTELDFALRFRHTLGSTNTVLEWRTEAGIFFFGEAFADPRGGTPAPVSVVVGRATLTF